jgi:glycosyltransferase involved in cell wall biosynthesis
LPETATRAIGIRKKLARWVAYQILKYSKAKIMCVGMATLDYFRKLGFSDSRLINLPIFVESDEDLSAYHARREQIFSRYSIKPGDFVLSAGSRIIHEKGYDLLIKAIALIDEEISSHIKVIIVGTGTSVPDLEKLISELQLNGKIILEGWLAIEDFKTLIANSDVFIHPARTDSYGGTTLGMAMGVPVIGSYGAGAAVDRIDQGSNGFLYDAEDTQTLANFIVLLYRNPALRKRMGEESLKTARSWPPSRGVRILTENVI